MEASAFAAIPPRNDQLQQIVIAKNLFLASLTLVIFDHMLTLSDEIAYVWRKPKSFVLWLFLAIRYYVMAALTVVSIGYFSPLISGPRCLHWSLFLPLGVTVPLSIGPSILLSVRVYAMYGKSKYILVALGTLLCAQLSAGLWQYTLKGGRVTTAPDATDLYRYHYCIYLPPASLGSVSSMYVFFDLSFNTILFVLTLGRTFYVYWQQRNVKNASSLLKTLAGNGAMYFGVIFCTNLGWAIMILLAAPGLRGVLSQPTAALTTIMMSRITLNLRSSGARQSYAIPQQRRAYTGPGGRKLTGDEVEGGIQLSVLSNRAPSGYNRMPTSPRSGGFGPYSPPSSPSISSPGILITSHTETYADLGPSAV